MAPSERGHFLSERVHDVTQQVKQFRSRYRIGGLSQLLSRELGGRNEELVQM